MSQAVQALVNNAKCLCGLTRDQLLRIIAANVAQGAGHFSPQLFIPDFNASLITLSSLDSATSIFAPNLLAVFGLSFYDWPLLETASFPVLSSVGAGLSCTSNPALTSLDLGSMITCLGNFSTAFCIALVSVNVSNWVPTNGTSLDLSNCALDQASVDLVLHRCVLAAVTTCNIDLSAGTNATPSAAGLVDKGNLIAAGNTVSTN